MSSTKKNFHEYLYAFTKKEKRKRREVYKPKNILRRIYNSFRILRNNSNIETCT